MIQLILLILINEVIGHTANDENNVFITGQNNERDQNKPIFFSDVTSTTIAASSIPTAKEIYEFTSATNKIAAQPQKESPDVMFVPNKMTEQTPSKNYYDEVIRRRPSYINMRDVMADTRTEFVVVDTEKPAGDIFFISGKNKETPKAKAKRYNPRETPLDSSETETPVKRTRPLRCNKINCSVRENLICAAKIDHGTTKYRLFLNRCYFRMVNCEFRYEENRYMESPIEECSHIRRPKKVARQDMEQVYYAPPKKQRPPIVETEPPVGWLKHRRSMSQYIDGALCGHTCPVDCPDTYNPECALSDSGHHVFQNHCHLDLHSCTFGAVWRRRSLAECVGGKKADVQQNRAFIGWMQKVGIVDHKGRLVH